MHQPMYYVLLTDEILLIQQLLYSTSGCNYRQVSVIAERSLNCNQQIVCPDLLYAIFYKFCFNRTEYQQFRGFCSLRKQI